MVNRRFLFSCSVAVVTLASLALALRSGKAAAPAESGASPEMTRLAQAFAGEWQTAETMERGRFFPKGGTRQGASRIWLGAGGTALIEEVHSDGSAGKLDGLMIKWWDRDANLYRVFTCFNDLDRPPCKERGTARWDGDTLVNEWTSEVGGRNVKFQDSFIQITPRSYTLVASIATETGPMTRIITTRCTRR